MNLLHHFLYQTAASLLSPAGAKARLSILIYHRVLPEVDAIFPSEATVASFDAQMNAVKAVFNVLPLPEAIARLKAGTLPSRAACITFDDGYADNYRLALPILQKHGLHATFFHCYRVRTLTAGACLTTRRLNRFAAQSQPNLT